VSALLVLSGTEIRSLLSPRAAIDSQRAALVAAAEGQVAAMGALAVTDPADDSLVFVHTGAIAGTTGVVCKFGLQVPGNAARGLPTVHAMVMVLQPGTGEPLACLDGTAVTALRTAGGIGAAAEVLARPDATRLGLAGAGVQAREAARMIAAVRPLERIEIASARPGHGAALAAELSAELGLDAIAVPSAAELAGSCDVIVTATTSREPVIAGRRLRPGVTVLTVGSYEPGRREIDLAASIRADAVFADDPVKAAAHCGPLVEAANAGHPAGAVAVGEVIAGRHPGRRDPGEVIVYHCAGLGVQDAALAWAAVERARPGAIGEKVAF
jgi:ornithine cyclodeaminase/alanine dehydrogenase-like protein (mu-crystallin family)